MVGVAFLVVSSMIGSGVFKKVGGMADHLGSPALVLGAWLVAGIITLLGSLSNAEVASMFPEAGGQYVYFKHIYGRFFAYLYGWTTFSVVQSATIAAVGFVFAESLSNLMELPELSNSLPVGLKDWGLVWGEDSVKPFGNLTVKLITIAIIWALVAFNIRGIKMGGVLSTLFATTIIVSISLIIFFCFGMSNGTWANLTHVPIGPAYYDQAAHGINNAPLGLFGAFFASMLGAFWAYEGWITIGYIGGEVKNGERNLPRGLMLGAITVTVVYLLVHVAYLYTMPIEQVAGLGKAEHSIAAVELLGSFLGQGGIVFLSLLILCSTFNATNASVIAAPRVYYALAKDGLFFKSAAEVHPKFRTPHKALMIQGVWATVLVLSGSFDLLTNMLIFAAFIFYGAGAWGVVVLRNKMPDVHRPFKVPLYPLIPAVFTLFSAALVVRTIYDQPLMAGFGLLLIAIGIPFYFIWDARRSV
jgi:basic amino acid/polyamine antiporter, APA family